jgi:small-conductance mechanosensitive channel
MDQEKSKETEQLEKLEKAAQETDHPEAIQAKAESSAASKHSGTSFFWFIPYLLAAIVAGVGLIYLEWDNGRTLRLAVETKIHRYLLGALGVAGVLAVARALQVYAIARVHSAAARFNLGRILKLVVVLALIFIIVPVLFVNWYAAIVSLGLVSLILGFSLQTPISSFVGWIYILMRAPYRVGDRIQIDDARGDVIDVGYLDTTLWEIGGRHISTDHPSGRLIKFPNTKVFSEPVFNYSWPLFPYIWNEIKLNIAYESDLEFVGATMQKIAEKELGESMMEKVKLYRDLLAKTPVDHLDVQERPSVIFRVSDNTWLEAIVRYLVHPKESGRVKSRLTSNLIKTLNEHPDRVLFPKSNNR